MHLILLDQCSLLSLDIFFFFSKIMYLKFRLQTFKHKLTLGSTQHPIQRVPRAISQGVKWERREAEHSHSYKTKVKNGGSMPALPIRLHSKVFDELSIGTT
jgi:hypothetical protein